MTKYRAIRTEVDGVVFDSKREAIRYGELKMLQNAGIIRDLELQPKYPIDVNGSHICNYFADFRYTEVEGGEEIVEDSKGVLTPVYRLKKKLVEALYLIEIVEV